MQKEWMLSALIGVFFVILSFIYPGFLLSKFFILVAFFFLAKAIRAIIFSLKHRQYEM
ncbi:hypothetical protein [uncultured Aliivibrio sp.]|uniref:hypothetical protein n=1 Tax=Aliivibrio salmonicida TaxID=40269 RepID=UPI0026355956|nr:hypothetical protein [uncultured Aliivibrio sp.]